MRKINSKKPEQTAGGSEKGLKILKGYVQLPCFTVEMEENGSPEMTCNKFLGWIWDVFFSPFWHGKITIYDEGEQE